MADPVSENAVLLSILVPVYNGRQFIAGLLTRLSQLRQFVAPAHWAAIEIVVIDNVSEDGTYEAAAPFLSQLPNLRIERESVHVGSAEQNVFRSFKKCLGRYTWILGVDDVPVLESVQPMMDLATRSGLDFIFFNSSIVDALGAITNFDTFKTQEPLVKTDIRAVIARLGYWNAAAGMSRYVLRTELFRDFDLEGLVKKTSPIYSHVTALLSILSGRSVGVSGLHLVVYRVVSYDVAHWKKAAAKWNVFDGYFWSLGMSRQLRWLEETGAISPDFFQNWIERGPGGNLYRPVMLMHERIIGQLRLMADPEAEPRNRMSESDFREWRNYVAERDSWSGELLKREARIFEKLAGGQKISRPEWQELDHCYHVYGSSFPFAPNLIASAGGFEVYRFDRSYYAVLGPRRVLLPESLAYLDPIERAPYLLIAPDYESLMPKVGKAAKELAALPPHEAIEVRSESFDRGLAKLWAAMEPMRRARSWQKRVLSRIRRIFRR